MKKKSRRKNPHAVVLRRLGGLVRSEAKKRVNKENGRRRTSLPAEVQARSSG